MTNVQFRRFPFPRFPLFEQTNRQTETTQLQEYCVEVYT